MGQEAAPAHAESCEECVRREQNAPSPRQQAMSHAGLPRVASRGTANAIENTASKAAEMIRCLTCREIRPGCGILQRAGAKPDSLAQKVSAFRGWPGQVALDGLAERAVTFRLEGLEFFLSRNALFHPVSFPGYPRPPCPVAAPPRACFE